MDPAGTVAVSVTSAPMAGSNVVVVTVSTSRLVDPVMAVDVLDDVTGRLVTVVFTVGVLIVVVDVLAAVAGDSVTPKMSLNEGFVWPVSVSCSAVSSGSREAMSLSWQVSLLLRQMFGSLSDRLNARVNLIVAVHEYVENNMWYDFLSGFIQ